MSLTMCPSLQDDTEIEKVDRSHSIGHSNYLKLKLNLIDDEVGDYKCIRTLRNK